ncbi:MAG: ribbon-helix-helix protein, CopG family [Candidatus Sumerlaeota bacterium]|nr:ribbon-helix-helix protein, CopG family [Candidatus Sumerlaeota bacterium]
MDKVLSARLDESVVNRIGSLAQRLHTSKKKIIETAITEYAARVDEDNEMDVFRKSWGAWHRKESAAQIVEQIRKEFEDSMMRHHR